MILHKAAKVRSGAWLPTYIITLFPIFRYILHNSECPATVFSILEANGKTVTLTSDTLFDLLMLKLTNVYKKKTTVESRGPRCREKFGALASLNFSTNSFGRFEIKDFLVKLGSVTVGGVFKGILVEVESTAMGLVLATHSIAG